MTDQKIKFGAFKTLVDELKDVSPKDQGNSSFNEPETTATGATATAVASEDQEQPKEQPKRRRGRPKGSTKKPPEAPGTATGSKAKQTSLDDELKKLQSDYVKREGKTAETVTDVKQESFISGAMLLLICDSILPMGIQWITGRKGEVTDLRLSPAEKQELNPLADEVAKQIMKDMSPITQFALVMSAIYASKI